MINTKSFFSGAYPHRGPIKLLQNGVYLLENVGTDVLKNVKSGDTLEIRDETILKNNRIIAKGSKLDLKNLEEKYALSEEMLASQLDKFVQNTLQYARKEVGLILGNIVLPNIKSDLKGKHVVVVIRGKDYREDFEAIIPYINEKKPILIGVDGGGDLIREKGFIPDLIVGDMDSVLDSSLKSAREVVVHAYPNGQAPGRERLLKLGVPHVLFSARYSEDIALLLAYEKGQS